jgi:hypothetical protein
VLREKRLKRPERPCDDGATMPITTASNQTLLDSIDPAAAEKAFASLRPRLLGISKDRLATFSVDLQTAAIAAATVARFIKDPAVRKRFLSLPKEEFSYAHLDDLEPAALAAWHAAVELLTASAGGTEAKLPASLVQEATVVRQRMLTLAEYHFGDDPDDAKEVVSIKQGTGYADLANDLVRLTKLYKKHHARVKLDPKNYVATDARDAKKCARQILVLLGEERNQEQKAWGDLVARAWTLLVEVYGEMSAAGNWLYRHEDGARLFPSLYSVGRRAPGRPAKPSGTVEAVAEEEEKGGREDEAGDDDE